MPGTVPMRTEAVPRRRAAVRSERVIAKPAQGVVELHGAFPPSRQRWWVGRARPMPATAARVAPPRGGSTRLGSAPQARDQVEDAENLGAVAHHLAIARLAPAQHAVAVDDECRAPGHVTVRVESAVGPDGGAVQVAEQRKRELVRGREGGVTCGTVA